MYKRQDGGCSVPIFCQASYEGSTVTLSGGIVSLDGQKIIKVAGSSEEKDSVALGEKLAHELLSKGGDVILTDIKKQLNI